MVTEEPKRNNILIPLIAGLSACVVALAAGIGIGVAVCMKKSKQVDPGYPHHPKYPQSSYNGLVTSDIKSLLAIYWH